MSKLNPSAACFVPSPPSLPPGPTYSFRELKQLGCRTNMVPPEEAKRRLFNWVNGDGLYQPYRRPDYTKQDWCEFKGIGIQFVGDLALDVKSIDTTGCAVMTNLGVLFYDLNNVIDFNFALSICLDGKLIDLEALKRGGPKFYVERLFLTPWMDITDKGKGAFEGWRVQHAVLGSVESDGSPVEVVAIHHLGPYVVVKRKLM